jgi:hypothetical protein
MTSGRFAGHASYLLADAGLPQDPALLETASEYMQRTWRGRRFGLLGGFLLGCCLPAAAGQALLALPLITAGYLLGVLLGEVLAPRPGWARVRLADLRARSSRDLLPVWARTVYWLLLVPVLVAPLLALVHRAPGATRIVTPDYTCFAGRSSWPPERTFILAALLGASGLVLTELTLAALTRRPRPADDPAMTRLDDVLRRMSAQSVAAGAAALGLIMIAAICSAISQAGHDVVCPRVPVSGPGPAAYPWAAAVAPWIGWVGVGCYVGTLLIVATTGWRTSPHRALSRGAPA